MRISGLPPNCFFTGSWEQQKIVLLLQNTTLFPQRKKDFSGTQESKGWVVYWSKCLNSKLICLQTSLLCHGTSSWLKLPTEPSYCVLSPWTSHRVLPLCQQHLIAAYVSLKECRLLFFKAYILDTQFMTQVDLWHFTQVEQQNQTNHFQFVIPKPYLSGSKVIQEEGLNYPSSPHH